MELAHSFLKTQNLKEAANLLNRSSASGPEGGANYNYYRDYSEDCIRFSEAMTYMSRLFNNIGSNQQPANFFQEQRNMLMAKEVEGKKIREMIEDKVSRYDHRVKPENSKK